MGFLTLLNFGSQKPKLIEIDLTIYKLIVEKSLLVLFFKIFTKNKKLRSNILHLIYIKKILEQNNTKKYLYK